MPIILPGSSASSVTSYVGSGGRNANLAAILEGQGGQQKRQHSSEKDRPMPDILVQEGLKQKKRLVFRRKCVIHNVIKGGASAYAKNSIGVDDFLLVISPEKGWMDSLCS